MRRVSFVLSVAALLAAYSPLHAQGAPAPASAPAPVTPGARRAAEELLQLMNIAQVLRSGTEASFDTQVQAQPLMAPFRATMQAWADKHLTWEEFGPKLVQTYAEEFTEGELRELIAFYKTPVGRKVAARTPALTRKGALIGAQIAEEHMAELQQMIQARAAELQKSGVLPGGSPAGGTPPADGGR